MSVISLLEQRVIFFFFSFSSRFCFLLPPFPEETFFSSQWAGYKLPPPRPRKLSGNIAFQTEVTMEQCNQQSAKKKKRLLTNFPLEIWSYSTFPLCPVEAQLQCSSFISDLSCIKNGRHFMSLIG